MEFGLLLGTLYYSGRMALVDIFAPAKKHRNVFLITPET